MVQEKTAIDVARAVGDLECATRTPKKIKPLDRNPGGVSNANDVIQKILGG